MLPKRQDYERRSPLKRQLTNELGKPWENRYTVHGSGLPVRPSSRSPGGGEVIGPD